MIKTPEILDYSVVETRTGGSVPRGFHRRAGVRVGFILICAVVFASAADHLLAHLLKFPSVPSGYVGAYRRVGPESGPQVFVAGSSLMVAGVNWTEVSRVLGQGIETWSVAGSSPDIWEEWQQRSPNSTTTIIGVSVYDLNETHVAPERAEVVPLSRTAKDLWNSQASSGLSERVVNQYALNEAHLIFPTAGYSDKVQEGIREKGSSLLKTKSNVDQHEGVVVEPQPPILAASESTTSVKEWSSGRLARRMAVLRAENRGTHEFHRGPKNLAFHRMLVKASERGKVIVAVLPVTQEYSDSLLNQQDIVQFEGEIRDEMKAAPNAICIRLDRIPGIRDSGNFLDLVHLNSVGRRLATRVFLSELKGTASN